MKNLILTLLSVFIFGLSFSQVTVQEIESEKLGETRQIKIQLPQGYEKQCRKNISSIYRF